MSTTDDTDDEIAFGPEISPGVHSALRRSPDGKVRRVACWEARDGQPLQPGAELAQVEDCECGPWHKLKTIYKLAAGDGPAQMATPTYRKNHDRIFGKKQKVGEA